MSVAKLDENSRPTLTALSNLDDGTIIDLWADPVTHRLLVDVESSGLGTVTSVSVVTANGVSGSVATSTTTPAITLTLGAITPTSVKGLVITTTTGTFTLTNAKTLAVTNTLTLSGSDSTVMTFPSTTQTVAGLTSVQTFTNKTITDSTNVLGGVTMTLGSDASYDTYYRGATGLLTRLANGTTGQVLTATTSAAPSWASPSFVTWSTVTGTGQNAPSNISSGYITNNAGLVTVILPVTAPIGTEISIAGLGAGGWELGQNGSQLIHFGNQVTTTGINGKLDSTNRYDSVTVVCTVANTTWSVVSSVGNLTVA